MQLPVIRPSQMQSVGFILGNHADSTNREIRRFERQGYGLVKMVNRESCNIQCINKLHEEKKNVIEKRTLYDKDGKV